MRYHADRYEGDASVYIADAPCFDPDCRLGSQEHLHVFTDAALRARDERIIRATFSAQPPLLPHLRWDEAVDAIIAAAEADHV